VLAAQILVRENSLFSSPAAHQLVIGLGPRPEDAFSHRELGCQPFVTMVKATHLLDGDHLGPILRLDGARVGTILLQGKMGPRPVCGELLISAENH